MFPFPPIAPCGTTFWLKLPPTLRACGPFSHRFSDLVFYRFCLDFDSQVGTILEHFSCFLHHFFEHRIYMDFWSTFYWFLVPLIMWKNDFNVILFAKNKKSQVPKIHRFVIDFGHRFGIILETFSQKFAYFSDIEFSIDFWTHVWWKFAPKCLPKNVVGSLLFA